MITFIAGRFLLKIAHKEFGAVELPAHKKRGRKPNGENRSELIRNFFEKNRESRNKDVVEFLNRKGLEVSPELVSAIRSKLGLPKSRKTGNVRMVKAEKMRKDKSKSDLPLPAILTRVFKGSRNGYKLAELPDLWDVNVSDWSNDSATSRCWSMKCSNKGLN
jgi:hypothetical protein